MQKHKRTKIFWSTNTSNTSTNTSPPRYSEAQAQTHWVILKPSSSAGTSAKPCACTQSHFQVSPMCVERHSVQGYQAFWISNCTCANFGIWPGSTFRWHECGGCYLKTIHCRAKVSLKSVWALHLLLQAGGKGSYCEVIRKCCSAEKSDVGHASKTHKSGHPWVQQWHQEGYWLLEEPLSTDQRRSWFEEVRRAHEYLLTKEEDWLAFLILLAFCWLSGHFLVILRSTSDQLGGSLFLLPVMHPRETFQEPLAQRLYSGENLRNREESTKALSWRISGYLRIPGNRVGRSLTHILGAQTYGIRKSTDMRISSTSGSEDIFEGAKIPVESRKTY